MTEYRSLDYRIAIGAGRLGISQEEYRRHVEAGGKWCCACQQWHPKEAFGVRRTAVDGLDNLCRRASVKRVLEYQARKRQQGGVS